MNARAGHNHAALATSSAMLLVCLSILVHASGTVVGIGGVTAGTYYHCYYRQQQWSTRRVNIPHTATERARALFLRQVVRLTTQQRY
jgi:hypothetical protein